MDFETEPQIWPILVEGKRVDYSEDILKLAFPNDWEAMLLEAVKFVKLARVDDKYAELLNSLSGSPSTQEQFAEVAREQAARAIVGGTATLAQSQMIDTEAGYSDIEPAILAQNIIKKTDGSKKIIGLAAGVRAKTRAALEAAQSQEEIKQALAVGRDDLAKAMAKIKKGGA